MPLRMADSLYLKFTFQMQYINIGNCFTSNGGRFVPG
jgi:hypothetical protein